MRRIGEVVRVRERLAVARAPGSDHPDICETALDEELEAVGRVVDVIGPVDRPYVVVHLPERAPASVLNEPLYVR
ncbi:MAG: H/ACA ribonucleoprotein complex subunit GAR1 [Halobacteriales archaeon]